MDRAWAGVRRNILDDAALGPPRVIGVALCLRALLECHLAALASQTAEVRARNLRIQRRLMGADDDEIARIVVQTEGAELAVTRDRRTYANWQALVAERLTDDALGQWLGRHPPV